MIRVLFLFLFSISLFAQDAAVDQQEKVEVILGIDKTLQLDFPPSRKIEVGNESILSYTLIPTKRQITLKGIKPGTSSMNIRNQVGDIKKRLIVTVTSTNQSEIVQKLKAHFENIEGLKISIVEGDVVVGGKIFVPNDIGKVVAILERDEYKDVIRTVELAPQTQLLIAKRMQEEIQKSGLRDVTVRVVNGTFVLEGVVTSEGEKGAAQRRAALLLPEKIQNLAQQFQATSQVSNKLIIANDITVNAKSKPAPLPKLLKFTAQFVELVKQYNKVFGFAWRPLLAGDGGSINIGRGAQRDGQTDSGGVTTASNNTLAATISNLFPKLNSAKSAGYARVVQSGVVVTQEKVNKVEIFKRNVDRVITAGQQNPIQTNIETGFTLSIEQPQVLQQERIEMGIGISVSSGAGGNATQDNRITTKMTVKSKDSAVVGGIVQKQSKTDYDRDFPGAGDNIEGGSPLFQFVRSKNYTTNRSQFVVFITPEIIENASSDVQEIRKKFRRRSR